MTIELNPITSGYSTGLINDNFQAIEGYVNDKLLQRDGVETGEINQMEVDLDMNSHFVFNLPEPTLEHQAARLQDVQNAVAGGAANLITFTPYGIIASENVQGAIQELVDEVGNVEVTTSTGTQMLDVALDDRLVYVNTISERDALNVSVGQQVSVSGIIYENTGVGSWENLSGYVTPEIYDPSDDDAALSAVSALGTRIRGKKDKTYTITSPVSFAAGTKLEFEESSIEVGATISADTPAITFGNNCSVDRLSVSVPTTFDVDILVDAQGSSFKAKTLSFTSVDQQDNRTSVNNSALVVSGSGYSIDEVSVTNFDNGVRVSGGNGYIGRTEVSSYVRGFWLDKPTGLSFQRIYCHTTSPNASGSPGHNGVLATDAIDFEGTEIRVEDSGEHGVRFGGQTTGGNNISIGRVITKNTGNCGLKMRSGADGINNSNVYFGVVDVEDCGDDTSPITNQIGLLLERVRKLHIGKVIVKKKDKTFSALHGVEFTDAQDVTIDSYYIEDVRQEGFFFNDEAETGIYRSINDIVAGSGRITDPGRHGIRLVMTNSVVFRRISFLGRCYMSGVGGAAIHSANATGGSMGQVSEFNIYYELAGTSTNNPLDGGYFDTLFNLNICGNGFVSVNAMNGSLWQQPDNGTTFVKTAGPTWTAI